MFKSALRSAAMASYSALFAILKNKPPDVNMRW